MNIIMVFVSTLDGKVTRWGYPVVKAWTSKEDQHYFSNLMRNASLVVMGSNTYKVDPIKPVKNRLMVIMTKNPAQFVNQTIPDQLVFSDEAPKALTMRLEKEGYDKMFMVGGPALATSFLKEKLIDEIWITLEPKIFGTGGNFAQGEKMDISLQLLSIEKINLRGTLLMKYRVKKNTVSHA